MLAGLVLANLSLAILIRQQYVINLLFWLATRAPHPLAAADSSFIGQGLSLWWAAQRRSLGSHWLVRGIARLIGLALD